MTGYHLPSSFFDQQLVLYHFNLYITRAAFVGTLTHESTLFYQSKRRDNHIRDLLLAFTRVVGKVQKIAGPAPKSQWERTEKKALEVLHQLC